MYGNAYAPLMARLPNARERKAVLFAALHAKPHKGALCGLVNPKEGLVLPSVDLHQTRTSQVLTKSGPVFFLICRVHESLWSEFLTRPKKAIMPY